MQGKTGHFFHLYIGIQQGATELRSFCFRSVTLTGPYFKDTEAVAKTLGLRSIRSNNRFLTKLTEVLTSEEKMILEDFFFQGITSRIAKTLSPA